MWCLVVLRTAEAPDKVRVPFGFAAKPQGADDASAAGPIQRPLRGHELIHLEQITPFCERNGVKDVCDR